MFANGLRASLNLWMFTSSALSQRTESFEENIEFPSLLEQANKLLIVTFFFNKICIIYNIPNPPSNSLGVLWVPPSPLKPPTSPQSCSAPPDCVGWGSQRAVPSLPLRGGAGPVPRPDNAPFPFQTFIPGHGAQAGGGVHPTAVLRVGGGRPRPPVRPAAPGLRALVGVQCAAVVRAGRAELLRLPPARLLHQGEGGTRGRPASSPDRPRDPHPD